MADFTVVIDDDPTGCQTVADVPVVTRWERGDLEWLLTRGRSMGFVLTNSRALPAVVAERVNSTIVHRAVAVARATGTRLRFLSRSDSTLRGHFRVELDAICGALGAVGQPVDLVLMAPAFFEAGRVTRDDVHLVRDGDVEVPVSTTPYASDPTFAYQEGDLRDWCRSRTGGAWGEPGSLGLDVIRDGASAVAHVLRSRLGARTTPELVVVNGVQQSDYDTVAEAVRALEQDGARVVVRCGPSYVASALGEPVPAPLTGIAGAGAGRRGGLVVVGSHVPTSTVQLHDLVSTLGLPVVELEVGQVLSTVSRRRHLTAVGSELADALGKGDAVLATSRDVAPGDDVRTGLDVAHDVASAVVEVVRGLMRTSTPPWVVAKGGITSATMLTQVLGIRRGWVLGQMERGMLPVWQQDPPRPEAPPCVIFPGNVGTPQTLTDVVRSLGVHRPTPHSLEPRR